MLRFRKLEITNFGPYQDTQVIDFPSDDGVVIIWGYNGFGKTTIMRALRYALWGNIVDEHGNEESIASYVNYEAVERGENMSVVLHIEYDNHDYILTRSLEKRIGTSGTSDADYAIEVFLQKGANIVSPTERDHFLKSAIPEGISRFYLFDGEVLQQYESLLKSGNDNTLIKDSIEDILGLPILEISRDNMALVRKEYSDAFNSVSIADSRTRQAGEKIKKLEEKEEEIKNSIADLKRDRDKAVDDLGTIDSQLENTETYRNYTRDIRSCEELINNWQETIEEKEGMVGEELDSLWEAHFKVVVDAEINRKEQESSTLSKTLSKQAEEKVVRDMLLKLVTEHPKGCNCPICDTIIDDKNISRIKEALKTKSVFIDSDLQNRNSQLITEIGILKGLKWEDHTEVIKTAIKEIEKLKTKIQLKLLEKKRLEDERRKLGLDSEESTIQGLIPEHDRLTKLIETYRDGIKDAQNEIEENKKAIVKLREKIKKEQSNTALEVAQNELDKCQDVCNLFDEAIEKFKLNLKENVQRDATEYFTSVAHNSDYKQLSINEEYGLEILTSNGVKVPHRSSGYVQVVAISLIAALHKNAPISGPIVMDSTFQRIDPRHKSNILSSLPNLGRQVIVLAYPEEIQENMARNVLKGKLKKEVTLEQISSFKTIIK